MDIPEGQKKWIQTSETEMPNNEMIAPIDRWLR